ncbi:hypothetical protein ACFX13_040908 [Malus domestica]
MIGGRGLSEYSGRGHSFWKFKVGSPKLREIPLKPKLNHPSWTIKVGFEWFTLGNLIQEMIEMSKKEGARGYIVKIVKCFY